MHTFPFFHSVRWYAYHACLCHSLAFYASLHACLHVHAWALLASVSSILQHSEVMDIRSKPTFVLLRTPHLFVFLLVCVLACTLAFLLCLPCLSRLSALCLFHMLCAPFSYIACLLVSCICHCMYTYGVRTYRAKAGSPRHKQKGKDESMSIWAKRLQSIGLGV